MSVIRNLLSQPPTISLNKRSRGFDEKSTPNPYEFASTSNELAPPSKYQKIQNNKQLDESLKNGENSTPKPYQQHNNYYTKSLGKRENSTQQKSNNNNSTNLPVDPYQASPSFSSTNERSPIGSYDCSQASSSAGQSSSTFIQPRCAICNGESTGIHFGTEACSACAAYFRRTIVLKRTYSCTMDNNCNIELDSQNRKKCKACRYKRCLEMGMDATAVQGRRDAIGKFSTKISRNILADPSNSMIQSPNSQSNEDFSRDIESPSTSSESFGFVLKELQLRYIELNRLRKIFYCQTSLQTLLDESDELQPCELNDFSECMYQVWRVEPRLCVDFISKNAHLKNLPPSERTKMFANFLLSFHAIEEPYLTWKYGGLNGDDKFWMMPNRVYMKFNKAEKYFDMPNVMDGLNLDKKSAINLFKPSFEHSMETVGEKIAFMKLSEIEIIGLIGIVLFDPTCKNLLSETRSHLAKFRNQLFNDLLKYYQNEEVEEPEIRLGNLIMVLQGVKTHALKYRENIQLLQFFKVVPMGELFDEIIGITAPC